MSTTAIARADLRPSDRLLTRDDLEHLVLLRDRIGGPTEAHLTRVEETVHGQQVVLGYVQRVTDADAYRGWVEAFWQDVRRANPRFEPPRLRRRNAPLPAYVSDSRWVVQCPCGNGPSASRAWGLAVCAECGAVWTPIFPPEAAALEAVLLRRPNPLDRDWWVGETLDDLRAQNAAHGIMEEVR